MALRRNDFRHGNAQYLLTGQWQIGEFPCATGCRLTPDQGFVVKMKRVRERFSRTGSVAIGEHHDQTAKRQIAVGVKDTVLPRGWFAQGEKWFAFRAKSLRKFRRHRKIIRCLTGAEIDNQRVDLLGCERAKTLVQRLKIGAVERAEAQITDMTIQNLAIKCDRRFHGRAFLVRQKHYPMWQPNHKALNSRAV